MRLMTWLATSGRLASHHTSARPDSLEASSTRASYLGGINKWDASVIWKATPRAQHHILEVYPPRVLHVDDHQQVGPAARATNIMRVVQLKERRVANVLKDVLRF